MGTSRSTDWTATGRVFSGRPDPVWTVEDDIGARLVATWHELPPLDRTAADPPTLGYRGVELVDPDGTSWSAYGGAVVRTGRGASEARADPGRRWERAVIATAPAGLLPPLA